MLKLFLVLLLLSRNCLGSIQYPRQNSASNNNNNNAIIHSFLQNNMEEVRFVNNTIKCGLSKVNFLKTKFVYNWEVKGLLRYLDYVNKFDQNLTLESENISFSSMDGFDGIWKFKLERTFSASQTSTNVSDSIANQVRITTEYKYDESLVNQKMNVGLQLDIMNPINHNLNKNDLQNTTCPSIISLEFMKPTRKYINKIKHKSLKTKKTNSRPNHVNPTTISTTETPVSVQAQRRRIFPSWFLKDIITQEDVFADDEFFSEPGKRRRTTTTELPLTNSNSNLDIEDEFYETSQIVLEFDIPNIQNYLDKLKLQTNFDANENQNVQFIFSIFIIYPYDPITLRGGLSKCSISHEKVDLVKGNDKHMNEIKLNKIPESQLNMVATPAEDLVTKNRSEMEFEDIPSCNSSNVTGHQDHQFPPFFIRINSTFNFTETFFEFSDMELVVEGVHIPAHRFVLANSSPTLAKIIKSSNNNTSLVNENSSSFSMPFSSSTQIPIVQMDPRIVLTAVQFLMEYLYTGTFSITKLQYYVEPSNKNKPAEQDTITNRTDIILEQLMIASHLWDLKELKQQCEKLLLKFLNAKNSIRFYDVGKFVNSIELIRKSINMMREHKHSILAEEPKEFQILLTKYPTLIFELFVTK